MAKQRILLTGATGSMGYRVLEALTNEEKEVELVLLALKDPITQKRLRPYLHNENIHILWGNLTCQDDVLAAVKNADMVLHLGALVSPKADSYPKKAMEINYGSTVNIIKAIKALGQEQKTKLVYIGTIAQTGDRMPPVHWGRVGDPIKPSVFDYYAVSKIAAERYVIESNLPYWVSLRQTGIMSPAMAATEDAIMFHNGLNNAMEYVSDRDSARLLQNLCKKDRLGQLAEGFWGHIYNIGGGESCRIATFDLYQKAFQMLNIHGLSQVFSTKWFATRNFHGQYYLDSDKLNDLFDFRRDSIDYFYTSYMAKLKPFMPLIRLVTALPGGKKLISRIVHGVFYKIARREHGTARFIENNMEGHIAAYWGSKQAWAAIAPFEDFLPFTQWDEVVHIDHGYDETKPEAALTLEDMKKAALFRGGACQATTMETGNWQSKLAFTCGFGHHFMASPRLVLEGGHWCPVCEGESWNYYQRAKIDPFFAQVWKPLHPEDEQPWVYPKEVSELDVFPKE